MLISEFASASGLSIDTVRFYLRQGLLTPKRSSKGGAGGYREFGPDELRIAAGIRTGQALGLSLAEIKRFIVERRAAPRSAGKGIDVMEMHRERLHERLLELQRLLAYMDRKIEWMKGEGDEPAWP